MGFSIAKCGALAALALTAVSACAFYDQQISIERALNSPSLNVRYSGARAALVEFRLNGVSLGTRTLNSTKTSGETSFTLDLSALSDGDNLFEVRLIDKTGKLVASETQILSADDGSNAPVKLNYPKMGATVQGGVDIKIGFGKEMRNAYVSFFVDNQFKAMSNLAPYTFTWDTTKETNGFHELEAMLVDGTSTTYKTRKVRVLVNNPGGRTDRITPTPVEAISNNTSLGPKTGTKGATIPSTVANTVTNAVTPPVAGLTSPNKIDPQVGSKSGVKAGAISETKMTGSRLVNPAIPSAKAIKNPVIQINYSGAATAAASVGTTSKIMIEKGVRLPMNGKFGISFEGTAINFDVAPRIVDGIPLAPVRYLFESAGGKVDWDKAAKIVKALAEGKKIEITMGDKFAKIGDQLVELEMVPFIEKSRAIIPLSFMKDTFNVNIEYDAATGHVLITKNK